MAVSPVFIWLGNRSLNWDRKHGQTRERAIVMLKAVNGCQQTLAWSTDHCRSPLSCACAPQGMRVSYLSLPSSDFPLTEEGSGAGLHHPLACSTGFGGVPYHRGRNTLELRRGLMASLKTWGLALQRALESWEGLTAKAADRAPRLLGVSWVAVWRKVGFGDLGSCFLLSV